MSRHQQDGPDIQLFPGLLCMGHSLTCMLFCIVLCLLLLPATPHAGHQAQPLSSHMGLGPLPVPLGSCELQRTAAV